MRCMQKRTPERRWNPDRARQLIDSSPFKRTYLARELGLEPKSFDQILIGRKPGRNTLRVLASLLNTNADYLLFQSNDARPKTSSVA